jgi:hypothetical protein
MLATLGDECLYLKNLEQVSTYNLLLLKEEVVRYPKESYHCLPIRQHRQLCQHCHMPVLVLALALALMLMITMTACWVKQ